MATCKECIHYEPCYEYGNILDAIHGGVECDSFKSTADIAPKSEVEELEKEIDRLKGIFDSYALQYGTATDKEVFLRDAKTEVAREVISEFKAMLKLRMMRLGIYPVALHRSLEHIEKKLTEKYTEGNNEKTTE